MRSRDGGRRQRRFQLLQLRLDRWGGAFGCGLFRGQVADRGVEQFAGFDFLRDLPGLRASVERGLRAFMAELVLRNIWNDTITVTNVVPFGEKENSAFYTIK